jgi:hypothetical protein
VPQRGDGDRFGAGPEMAAQSVSVSEQPNPSVPGNHGSFSAEIVLTQPVLRSAGTPVRTRHGPRGA